MNKELKFIEIYTDGACKGNPGLGGWGAILIYHDHKKEICGSEKDTTNNIMELTAVIKALDLLKEECHVILTTDSNYVKDGITDWINNWKSNGWQTANKKPVKNQDLWEKLDLLSSKHFIEWKWVKGHSGNPGNELADQLANEAIEQNEYV